MSGAWGTAATLPAMRSSHHISKCALALIATALLALPPAAPAQDLRSPDARDAGLSQVSRQDLRSPDARDAAAGRHPAPSTGPAPVAPAPAPPAAAGFDWTAALVGAAAALGLVLLAAAGALLARRRTHRDQPAAA